MAFVHLHNHTEYSLLDGMTHVKEMVRQAAEFDMPAIAITDHGVMGGVPELCDACTAVEKETGKKVKPIYGCEVYFTTDDTLARDGLNLNVRGGAVTFNRKMADLDDTAPAGDPALWLDATAADSFVYTNLEHGVAGRDYIHRWNDRRPDRTQYYADPMTMSIDTNRPFVAENAFGGLPAIDFGNGNIYNNYYAWDHEGDGYDAARMKLSANINVYDGFIVLRMKNPDSYYECKDKNGNDSRGRPAIFGVDSQDFTRWGSDKILAGYAGTGQLSAYWCIDGVSYVPYYDAPVVITDKSLVMKEK